MAEKGANIDLLFRNGLKDMEVLPPVGTWNSIYPVIRKKQKPYILLRSAALIAVLLSLSYLAYRWSSEISVVLQNPVLALGEESVQPSETRIIPVVTTQSAPITENPIKTNRTFIAGNTLRENNLLNENEEPSASAITPIKEEIKYSFNFSGAVNRSIIRKIEYPTEKISEDKYSDLTQIIYDVPQVNKSKWSLSAIASPSYYMRSGLGNDEISSQLNSSEKSKISYSGGVGFAYRITNKLSIQSGLFYTSIGQQIEDIYSFGGFRRFDDAKGDHNFEVLTSGGVIYTENADVFLLDNSGGRVLTRFTNDVFDPAKANLDYINHSLQQTFSYLEMPLILRYKVIDKSIDFNLIGGLSYNLLVNNSVHTYINGTKYFVGETEGLNPFMVSSSFGMGMEYSLSRKISLNLEPMFRYYLNPFGETPGIKAHPYSFGVFSGLSYRF